MIPWEHVDTATIPGGREPLKLMRRGGEFSIRLGAVELMGSRAGGSEAALAREACQRLGHVARAKVLIGGLGMGFTLRAALEALGPEAEVVVAELVPAVVAWARGPLSEVFAGLMDDPRVAIIEGDVGAIIRAGTAAYDAILLDVDNGPAGQTSGANDGLYSARGLAAAHRALRPGGVLAVWSEAPDAAFAGRMKRAGFALEEKRARANAGRGARHIIWLGIR
ncbi:hypothetical protein RHAL1_02603 [Beijerinckiaceae bacterium RH AL1]|nr:hypothetical protein RHCH11_RHCH11_02548 [Beijerinckiaceae bacterium RH CH11]VVB47115.1 hypothetical protein RHAL8_02544 [Beijerinckiaceae bacterium RH AL8]VVC55681.1 hypothetical protein RHAL1_02603 [Beijerinckiaceae bacterium RH AL1]